MVGRDTGQRVYKIRTEKGLAISPSIISSGCPYCLTMLSDGTKSKEVDNSIKTMDVKEILKSSVVTQQTRWGLWSVEKGLFQRK